MPWLNRSERKKSPAGWAKAQKGRFHDSPEWRALRADMARQEPLCAAHQAAGQLEPATVTDHIVRIGRMGGAKLSRRNLWRLCESCHNRKSAMESNGLVLESIRTDHGLIPTAEAKEWLLAELSSQI